MKNQLIIAALLFSSLVSGTEVTNTAEVYEYAMSGDAVAQAPVPAPPKPAPGATVPAGTIAPAPKPAPVGTTAPKQPATGTAPPAKPTTGTAPVPKLSDKFSNYMVNILKENQKIKEAQGTLDVMKARQCCAECNFKTALKAQFKEYATKKDAEITLLCEQAGKEYNDKLWNIKK